jgi:hypothetical protein
MEYEAPEAAPKKAKEPKKMTKTELHKIVSGMITRGEQYVDGTLSPERAKATDYYMGRPFGNEEPGRSKFVSTDVRDSVQQILPAMMRSFFSAESAVEFDPPSEEDVDGAEQATDFVQSVYAKENPGFLHTMAVIKDGLVRKTGIVKWWWDDTSSVTNHKLMKVAQDQLELLMSDEELKVNLITPDGETPAGPPSPEMPQGSPPVPTFTVELTRTVKDGMAKWEPVPPEELLYTRDERSPDTASALFHRTRKTRGELISMGISEKDIDEHGGDDPSVRDNDEASARNTDQMASDGDDDENGKANQKHLYCEGFARIDYDGDNIAELRRVCALGPDHHIVKHEPAEDVNFAIFVPDPEPHTMDGLSYADRTMDIQLYKSMLMRGLSDSLAMSIFPRIVYKQNDGNLADILNNQPGAPIRTQSGPEAVKELFHAFPGKEIMPVINLADQILERRTGQQHGAAGLNPDALQSSTQAAVAATVTASAAQQELLVRIFAESVLKRLFKGIYKLLLKHQPRARMVKLRNRWVNVDPRSWNADMDVSVKVVMGAGLLEEKIQTLMWISEQQSMALEKLGPQNPVVSLKEWRDTIAEIAELRGRMNTSKYFKPITKEQIAELEKQAAEAPPPETPEMVLAKAQIEIEKMKATAKMEQDKASLERDLAIKQAEMSMRWKEIQLEDARERQKAEREDDRERDKQAADIALKTRELELKHMVNIQEAELTAQIERERMASQAGPGEEKSEPAPARGRSVNLRYDPEGNMKGWDEMPVG